MHELVVVKQVFGTVNRYAEENNIKKVARIHLRIGDLRDYIDNLVQKYFDHISKGSRIEGAEIVVNRVPGLSLCECGTYLKVTHENFFGAKCPGCGSEKLNLISGQEFLIAGVEVID